MTFDFRTMIPTASRHVFSLIPDKKEVEPARSSKLSAVIVREASVLPGPSLTGSARRTRGYLRTHGPPSVWGRRRPLRVEAGRPYPSRGKTSRRERNAHLELKALQKQAPHSPAPQLWGPLERGRGGCAATSGRGRRIRHQKAPLPTSSHLPSAARRTYYQVSRGAWAPGPLLTTLCSASLTLRTPGVGLRAGLWAGKGPGKHRPRCWGFVPFCQTRAGSTGSPQPTVSWPPDPPTGTLDWPQQRTPHVPGPSARACRPYFPGRCGAAGQGARWPSTQAERVRLRAGFRGSQHRFLSVCAKSSLDWSTRT